MPTGIMTTSNARNILLFLVFLLVVIRNVEGWEEKNFRNGVDWQLHCAENIYDVAQSGFNWTVSESQSSLSAADPSNPVSPNKGKTVASRTHYGFYLRENLLWPTKCVSFRWWLILQRIFPNFHYYGTWKTAFQISSSLSGIVPISSVPSTTLFEAASVLIQ